MNDEDFCALADKVSAAEAAYEAIPMSPDVRAERAMALARFTRLNAMLSDAARERVAAELA